MLFGKGLHAMKKAKKWQTGLDLCMCTTARHTACESTRVFLVDQSSFPVGMQLLQLMVGLLCERHLCNTHMHACMHAKHCILEEYQPPPLQRPVSQHTDEIQWMTRMRNSTDSKQANHTVTIIHVGLVACNNDSSSFHNYSVGVQLK